MPRLFPNHPKVTVLTPAIASQLPLDLSFVNFVFAKERPECFRYWVEDAGRGWTCFVPESVDRAYSLWSTNSNQTLLLVTGKELSFAKGYHDDPGIEWVSKTSQGVLADLLDKIWSSGSSRDELTAAAQFCGFRFLVELFAHGDSPLLESPGWEDRWRQLIADIDAKSR